MAALERGWGEWAALRAAPRAPPARPRRKHRRPQAPPQEEEEEGCPARKKRLLETERPGGAGGPWAPCAGQPARPAPASPCEEMEQVMGEPQGEAARRRLQEIEDRIAEEEEEELEEEPPGPLPTLVLSDTLKTGLKADYTGGLTQKIIESMSRPSMELVVWKPLPEFLTKKTKSVPVKNYKPTAERCLTKPATLEAAFSLQTGEFSAPQQTDIPSTFCRTVEPSGCSEEEMEL